jgi:ATP-dependent Lon protease
MTDNSNIPVDTMSDLLKGKQIQIPDELPILDVENMVLFPYMISPYTIILDSHKQLISDALQGDRLVGVFPRLKPEHSDHGEFSRVGCVAMILRMLKIPDGSFRILIHGLHRIALSQIIQDQPYLKGKISMVEETAPSNITVEALIKQAQNILQKTITLSNLPEELGVAALNMNEAGKLADLITSNLNLKPMDQLTILSMNNTQERLEKVLAFLEREVEVLELGNRIRTQVKSEMEKNQREYLLREQIKAINKELGEGSEAREDIRELKEKLKAKSLPEDVRQAAEKEIKRIENMPQMSPEYTVSRSYLESILELPWLESTQDNLDINKAKEILDEDHYDLDKIKDRILEYLSVVKLKECIKGPILCFVGPPGVGKTSLGNSIARALGRKFYHFSLGGMRDEAEIRGHRRTYIGALPGRIISGLKICGSNNPVMMLDEVDKLGSDFRGDPASALLEVLDPEQNNSFRDHYLDLPFDLSKVMFITTANILDTIPPALHDRMEILRLAGYTLQEKIKIARRYLIPKEYKANGVSSKYVIFTDKSLKIIIENYTRESGLRNLQREIGNICRKVARRVAEGEKKLIRISAQNVSTFLGPPGYSPVPTERPPEPGLAIGLAWTQTGGEVLFIESSATRGKGKLLLTGQLGDVMKESAQAALTYIHAMAPQYKIKEDLFSEQDIHVHVPTGAIPKDGPSAGITICASLASLLMKKPVKKALAMTGEITLKGNVLAIGGIKEKVLAAHRAGIKEIILPEENKKDLEEIPSEVKKAITFHFVKKMDGVIKLAFGV